MALKYIGLVPNNEEAWEICRLPQNHRHIIYDANSSQPMALGLDIDGRHKDSAIVATIGRHSSHNIVLPFSNETSSRYSRNQCTFFHNRANGELLVEDDSKTYTTHLEYEDPALSMFQFDGHPRRRMVKYPAKLYIWFSKAKFQLLINTDPDVSTTKRALMRLPVSNSNAPTNLLVPELPKTRRQTRVSTPLIHAEQPKIIWNGVCELGRGQTGVVWSALNLLNGDHLAVKVIKTRRDDIDEKTLKEAVKAQIQTLQQLNHPGVISFYHSQGWEFEADLQVFMELYSGDLRSYLQRDYDMNVLGPRFLVTMLEIFEFLAGHAIVHGDIKPANILYDEKGEFYLTDFGYMGSSSLKKITAATPQYSAPEVYHGQITTASDIWSLGIVMLDILKIRPKYPQLLSFISQYDQYYRDIVSVVALHEPKLAHMLCIRPEDRSSATKCLDELNLRNRVATGAAAPDAAPTQNVEIPMMADMPGQHQANGIQQQEGFFNARMQSPHLIRM